MMWFSGHGVSGQRLGLTILEAFSSLDNPCQAVWVNLERWKCLWHHPCCPSGSSPSTQGFSWMKQQVQLTQPVLGSLFPSTTTHLLYFPHLYNISGGAEAQNKGMCVQDSRSRQGTASVPLCSSPGFVNPFPPCSQLDNSSLSYRNMCCVLTALSIGFE